MKKIDLSEYRYHHMGIPTEKVFENERYSEYFKMYTSDAAGDFRIQYHRFEEGSPLHPLIKTVPHVALQVDNLQDAVKGHTILLGPYEPIPGYKVAIIKHNDLPFELIETELTIEELWNVAEEQADLDSSGLNNKDK